VKDYERDAYVEKLTYNDQTGVDYMVIVDIIKGEEVLHLIASCAFGKKNAKIHARNLNKWRDQTRSIQ
jgi:hypothetical protein